MRLLTRSDFDGLACGALLEEKGIVDSYKFIHPKDAQDGKVAVGKDDILANIPYVPGCGLWFDHHDSETVRLNVSRIEFEGAMEASASSTQVIWDYYGGEAYFGSKFKPLVQTANISGNAAFTQDEVMTPNGWILLAFIVDPRTGLGHYKDYRVSNYQLMLDIIRYCREMPINEIINQSDVKERVDRYFEHQKPFKAMLKRISVARKNMIVTNLLEEKSIYSGNRFIIYGLYPDQNVEFRIQRSSDKNKVVIACGHSILNRSCRTNIGKLMLQYGGGGHSSAGTCQIPIDEWETTALEIQQAIISKG